MDGKSFKNVLIIKFHTKTFHTLIGAKPSRIRFDKIDRFINVCDGTRYFVLFGSEKYDAIFNRSR